MKKIIISIHPKHVEKILDGTKKYEYRTKIAIGEIDSLFIYATSPVKKVVAEAEIIEVIKLVPEALWEVTNQYAGIEKASFDRYFKNREFAYAYKLGKTTLFNQPKTLLDYGISYAPQSYIYLK